VTREFSDLTCDRCGLLTEHELHYAGRLLESVRCTGCGHRVVLSHQALLPAYLHDLEHRLVSKPQRMYRRVTHDPAGFLAGLPFALLRQPVKFARELWSLLRR
jgi:DNA-directed RNA polymerase subunit RPC12/RpoP